MDVVVEKEFSQYPFQLQIIWKDVCLLYILYLRDLNGTCGSVPQLESDCQGWTVLSPAYFSLWCRFGDTDTKIYFLEHNRTEQHTKALVLAVGGGWVQGVGAVVAVVGMHNPYRLVGINTEWQASRQARLLACLSESSQISHPCMRQSVAISSPAKFISGYGNINMLASV